MTQIQTPPAAVVVGQPGEESEDVSGQMRAAPGAYAEFLRSKRMVVGDCGIAIPESAIHSSLFPFQRAITRWALRKGRAAIFADTGLGKSRMQLEWARLTGQPALIVAPLGVAHQTVREASAIGIDLAYAKTQADVCGPLAITNYERIAAFDASAFSAVVLDESSILKAVDGETRKALTSMFAETPYRLCCTATPAPNDIAEIANHAEFLGIMSRADMLASFFVHDDEGWRLKGHASEGFYRWLASWGMSVRKPSDIGFEDDGYDLPPLRIEPVWVDAHVPPPPGKLFGGTLHGIQDRSRVRKVTVQARTEAAAALANADADQWILWCGLNDEGRRLRDLIPGSALVEGSDDPDAKVSAIEAFQRGDVRVLITKAKIGGWGLNLQNAHKMAFVGLSDSWEAYYQCVRRCYRYGQAEAVEAFVVLSTEERAIYENVMRKEAEAVAMSENLVEHVRAFECGEVEGREGVDDYETADVRRADYRLMLGDSTERLAEIEGNSIGLSVFSPPFLSLYTYSPTPRDVGNSRTEDEFYAHFGRIIDQLLRVTMPGRNCCVHVAQVPAMLARDGYIGVKDFRGGTIKAFEERGWIYHGEVCIDKDPQAQAIRTHSKALLFTQLRKDSSWLRPALADYILVFRKPGENPEAVHPDITNDEWIEWARPIWYGIRESDTLNTAEGKEGADDRHIAPLQLGTIERCVRLWSNPGDLVLSPFAGIGSEGYVAVKHGRRFVGIELKRSYWQAAVRNLARATVSKAQKTLDFDAVAP